MREKAIVKNTVRYKFHSSTDVSYRNYVSSVNPGLMKSYSLRTAGIIFSKSALWSNKNTYCLKSQIIMFLSGKFNNTVV